jgi:hypothetical protein
MRSILCAVMMAAAVAGGSSGAFAQRAGVEVYSNAYSYGDSRARPTGVYRYRVDDAPVVVIPVRPASCGEFRYWNGERCVDARVVPPDLK